MTPCAIQLWYSCSSGEGLGAAHDSFFKGQRDPTSGESTGTTSLTKHTDNSLKLQGNSGMSETDRKQMGGKL